MTRLVSGVKDAIRRASKAWGKSDNLRWLVAEVGIWALLLACILGLVKLIQVFLG